MDVFVSAMGQIDNVGDTALRRAYLDVLREVGPLHVFVGNRPPGYVAGLRLQPQDIMVTQSVVWRSMLKKASRRGLFYAHNAGEIELQRSYAARYIKLAPLLAANRLAGGRFVHVGLGVRKDTRWRPSVTAVLKLADVVTWRDAWSASVMKVGDTSPDWAFATGQSNDRLQATTNRDGRDIFAISLRYNGQPYSATWLANTRRLVARTGLKPVVVSQIRRDGPLAAQLATELGGEAIQWESDDMYAEEIRLREVYARSNIIMSDRLHALVIGLTEGATPLALVDSPTEKTARTLLEAGIPGVSIARDVPSYESALATIEELSQRSEDHVRAVIESRSRLDDLAVRLVSLAQRK